MAKVKLVVNGIEGEVEQGVTLLEGASAIGTGVAHLCFGNAICSTCRVEVVSGGSGLSEKQIKERVSMDYHLCFGENMRLCCQAKIVGSEAVEVRAPKLFRAIAPRNKKK